jgi:ribonuclease Z
MFGVVPVVRKSPSMVKVGRRAVLQTIAAAMSVSGVTACTATAATDADSLASASATTSAAFTAIAPQITVTLLGTGAPTSAIDRFGPSTLVEAGEEVLLFDAGRGALQRLRQTDVRVERLTAVFLTHLHSDHVVGLPDVWLTGWLLGRRTRPLELVGPQGTVSMAAHLRQAFSVDVAIRERSAGLAPEGALLAARDVSEGVVLERNGMRVTAFPVEHFAPGVAPSIGFRIDYAGRSVVLSGDTAPSSALVAAAKGVDVLIHEVEARREGEEAGVGVVRHTSPEQAAKIFNATRPALAVFSHILLGPGVTIGDVERRSRAHYRGPIAFGVDLMQIRVGETVTIGKAGS